MASPRSHLGCAEFTLQASLNTCRENRTGVVLMGLDDLLQAQDLCVRLRLNLKTMNSYMKEGGLSSIFSCIVIATLFTLGTWIQLNLYTVR
jgi:hypothetical protein